MAGKEMVEEQTHTRTGGWGVEGQEVEGWEEDETYEAHETKEKDKDDEIKHTYEKASSLITHFDWIIERIRDGPVPE